MAFWLPLLTGLGSILGAASAGKSASKTAESNAASQQANSELAAYAAQQNAKAQQAQDVATRPAQRLQTGMLGNMVSGWTPQKTSWGGPGTIPQISGGYNDLQVNDMSRQNADLMQRDALLRQMQGQGAADITSVGQIPDVTKNYPKSSWLDSLLGYGALGANLGAGVLGAFNNRVKRPQGAGDTGD